MQKYFLNFSARVAAICSLLLSSLVGSAQEKIEINTEEVETWFERNWMWVVGAIVLIILIAALKRNRYRHTTTGGKRRTTTVVEDAAGNTKSVTTTEEKL